MKKLCILFIFCIFALCSCTNQHDAYNVVKNEFPNAEILNCDSYSFIVIDSTKLFYIQCLDLRDGRITNKKLIKTWQNQYQKH